MASRKTLRERQLRAAENASASAHQLAAMSDSELARATRAELLAQADVAVEIIETLARVEA